MRIGIVFYPDDNKVFRTVYPSPGEGEAVLDDPRWTRQGCDPDRKAQLAIIDEADIGNYDLTGVP